MSSLKNFHSPPSGVIRGVNHPKSKQGVPELLDAFGTDCALIRTVE